MLRSLHWQLRALRRPLQPQIRKTAVEGRLRIRKHAVLPAPFWLKYNRKNLPIRQYGEIFSADFISKIHWQNCFAPKKSKFCAELRRDGAGMLTHGKTAQRRSPCKICLLRRMFSYAESAKQSLFFMLFIRRPCSRKPLRPPGSLQRWSQPPLQRQAPSPPPPCRHAASPWRCRRT